MEDTLIITQPFVSGLNVLVAETKRRGMNYRVSGFDIYVAVKYIFL